LIESIEQSFIKFESYLLDRLLIINLCIKWKSAWNGNYSCSCYFVVSTSVSVRSSD